MSGFRRETFIDIKILEFDNGYNNQVFSTQKCVFLFDQ